MATAKRTAGMMIRKSTHAGGRCCQVIDQSASCEIDTRSMPSSRPRRSLSFTVSWARTFIRPVMLLLAPPEQAREARLEAEEAHEEVEQVFPQAAGGRGRHVDLVRPVLLLA